MAVTQRNFDFAIEKGNPSALHEMKVEVLSITWADIGSIQKVKQEIKEIIQYPLNYRRKSTSLFPLLQRACFLTDLWMW